MSLGSALVLGACVETAPGIPLTRSPELGKELADPFTAGAMFADICLVRGPTFDYAAQGLQKYSFVKSVESRRYFHTSAHLTVKIDHKFSSDSCTVSFVTKGPEADVERQMRKGISSVTSNSKTPALPLETSDFRHSAFELEENKLGYAIGYFVEKNAS